MRTLLAILAAAVVTGSLEASRQAEGPAGAPPSLRFAVIGDNGTGERPQYEVGEQMASARGRFPFEFVIMLGDNMYGRQRPADFVDKFEQPYAPLLKAGVLFYAALGNHDDPTNRFYAGFNMGGERYYTFVRKHVRFFVFDTNMMDPAQLRWIGQTLARARESWKICYFHHPLYSSGGRHGSDIELRVALEPLMLEHGVHVAFSGHEHVYERTHPQKGITYFVEGSSGKLRRGDITRTDLTAASFDEDRTFMLVGITGDELSFQTISRAGRVVDSGVIHRRPPT